MAMEMRLVQRQSQRLILSPQMQQAIFLLQLPLMELKTMVEQEMIENPVLEEIKENENSLEESSPVDDAPSDENSAESDQVDPMDPFDESWQENMEDDVYIPPNRNAKEATELHDFLETLITKEISLEEHLLSQLRIQDFTEEQIKIGEYIIGNLNDDGYLTISIEDIAKNIDVSLAEIELVLAQIQLLDPVGVASRNLAECLQVQLISMGKQDHLAYKILTKPIGLLERKKYPELAKLLNVSIHEVQQTINFLSKLEPKPGRKFTQTTAMTIIPDVVLQKIDDEYVIISNDQDLPRLRISQYYRKIYKDKSNDKETRQYIKDKIQSAMWFIKNIQQRQKTIYRITEEIIKTQRDFLENGTSFLKPLTLKQIAERLGLNLSTISRAVMNKYIQTPQGTFEIRKLFSTSIPKDEGSTSAAHVQQRIADLISAEDSHHPISDQGIANKLKEEGIRIARRTVAKYREEKLKISSSNLRKEY